MSTTVHPVDEQLPGSKLTALGHAPQSSPVPPAAS